MLIYKGKHMRCVGQCSSMAIISIGLLLAMVAATVSADCAYTVKNIKLDTCDGKPNDSFKLKDLKVDFNNDCNIQIFGCAKFTKEIKSLDVEYTASKNNMQVMKDKKVACDSELFGQKIKCPFAKDFEMCADDKWIVEVPKGMLAMAAGEIKAEGKVVTDAKTYCYKASALIKKK